ncbi:hypothetical protein AGLY_005502 [Aphis glycines]|uniref:Integrase catalytic domain-containing protein n=1 Tax=Aphis glycines TaxID=307491 RepID=A0A6G0TUP5_APHGL|nr:hypothetical protein AGLY_005502 [Aphis glycines]
MTYRSVAEISDPAVQVRHLAHCRGHVASSGVVELSSLGLGVFAVIQHLSFRRNAQGQCIDYIQFRHADKTISVLDLNIKFKPSSDSWSEKICGKLNAFEANVDNESYQGSDGNDDKEIKNSFIDHKGQLQPIPLSNRPLDRLTFDYLGPLTPSNNKKYVLVAACNNTKFIFTKAVESATAQSTINFIIQIISQWGCFRQFSSDRGTHFKNQMVNEVCENLGIKQILSTSYSPQTQGFVEKINDVLCNSIKNYIDDNNQSRWSYYLPYVTLSYNATPQTSTKYSPFYLMHGFEPYFPIDNKLIPTNIPYDIKKSLAELNKLRDKIPNLIKTAQESQKKYHDQKHRLITFKPGDSVLIKFPLNTVGKCPKLSSKYKGPFKIIKKLNDLNYKVQLSLNNKITEDIIHVRRMKPYIHR